MQTILGMKLPSSWSNWRIPLLLGVLSLLVMAGGEEFSGLLRYEREAILKGELWRLLSAHLTHLGWSHLGLNLAGLLLVWVLCGSNMNGVGWGWVLLISSLGVSLGLLLFNPALQWYVGLSGVLNGLLSAGCLAAWYVGHRDSLFLLVILSLKIGWEQWAGPLPGSESTAGGMVVVDAHLYGVVAGILSMVPVLAISGLRRRVLSH